LRARLLETNKHGHLLFDLLLSSLLTAVPKSSDYTLTYTKRSSSDHKRSNPKMRFLLLATFLALVATVCAEKNHMLVRRKNRDITQAINNFCGYTEDMVSLVSLPCPQPVTRIERLTNHDVYIGRPQLQSNPRQREQQPQCCREDQGRL
jgi:hypothetical protein